jgi:hypothetical protein
MRTRQFSRRVFFAVLAVLLWFGFLVDGSHALFNDQVALTGNSIVTGTTDLLISNSQNGSSTVFEKSRVGFVAALSPGQAVEKYFLIKNSSDGNIDFSLGVNANIPAYVADGLGKHTNVQFIEVGSDGLPNGTQATFTLDNLYTAVVQTPFILPKGVTKRYKMVTSLDADYTKQGESLTYDLAFVGTQIVQN